MNTEKNRDQHFIERAIELSKKGMDSGKGGPFGCIVVKGDEIIGEGSNEVTSSNDPTAHAEVVAIRNACEIELSINRLRNIYKLRTLPDVSGCNLLVKTQKSSVCQYKRRSCCN